MEWALLMVFAGLAALAVGVPLRSRAAGIDLGADEERLREERLLVLAELRELDDDASAGRISAADRHAGRRALAPRLRAAHEALRALGDEADVPV